MASAEAVTRYFLGIGVGKFDDATLALPNAERDVRDIQAWFVGQGAVAPSGQLARLGESPTAEEIRRGLAMFFEERKPDDFVIVYVSSHGELERTRTHLFGRDTPRQNLALRSVEPESIGALIGGSRVHNLLFILDVCIAGPISRAIRYALEQSAEDGNKRDPHRPHLHAFLTSTYGRAAAVDGAFASAFLKVVSEERWTGSTAESISLQQVVSGVNELLGPQVADLHTWGPGVVTLIPNRNFAARRLGALVAEYDLQHHVDPSSRGVTASTERGFYFRGRVAELRRIVSWLNAPPDQSMELLAITGQPGSGKSALLSRVAVASDPELRAELLRNAAPDPTTLPATGALARLIWCRHKTAGQVVVEIAAGLGVMATTADSLIELVRNHRAVIALDALDEAEEPHRIAMEVIRPLTASTNVRVLVATRRRAVHRSDGADLLDALGVEPEEILDVDDSATRRNDMIAYVEARLRARKLNERQIDEAEIGPLAGRIADAAGYSFLVAAIAARFALPNDQKALPREAGSALAAYIEQMDAPERHRAVLRPLAYAQGYGLPWAPLWPAMASTLARLMGDDRIYGDDDVTRTLTEAGDLIVETTEAGRPVYRLFHEALAENLRGDLDGAQGHGALSGVMLERASGRPWRDVDSYVRANLAPHLLAARRYDELFSLLSDPAWERARRAETNDPLAVVPTVEIAIARLRADDPVDPRAMALCVIYSMSSAAASPPTIDVLARSGQLARARAMAHNLTAASDRIQAFSHLARGFGVAGRADAARQCLDEAARAVNSMAPTHRPMAHAWIAQGAMEAGERMPALEQARMSFAACSAPGVDDWGVPNGLFWAGLAANTLADDALLASVRAAVDEKLRGRPGRNQVLQAAAVCGHRKMLSEILSAYRNQGPGGIVRPGNLALALIDAGMKAEAETLFAAVGGQRPYGEDDAIKRWSWALALAGHPQQALQAFSWIGDSIERTRAVPRLVDALLAAQAMDAVRAVVHDIGDLLKDPSLDVRSTARLLRALYMAGETQRALELSEELIAAAPDLGAPTDLKDLVDIRKQPEVRRMKHSRRELVTSWVLVPDADKLRIITERLARGEIADARLEVADVQVPVFRARALTEIARADADPASALSSWGDAMVAARAAGPGVTNDTLEAGLALLAKHGRRTDAEELRARLSILYRVWALERFAEEYATIRRTRASSDARTSLLTSIVHRARLIARAGEWTRQQVAQVWQSGDDGKRIWVLALLQEKPELATGAILAEGIRGSRSAFEQYQALAAACASNLPVEEVALVRGAIEAELRRDPRPDGYIPAILGSSDRIGLAREFLARC